MKDSTVLTNQQAHGKEETLPASSGREWRRFLLLMVIVLPILAMVLIGAYGLFIWIMQMLFWGPPS